MKNRLKYLIAVILSTIATTSCVCEFTVVDNSFEFATEVIFDDSANEHRLILTRRSGMEDNEYKISFTLDGESTLVLTDMNGTTHEGSMTERFSDISTKTYTLAKVSPGEHTLDLEISTKEYKQALAVTFVVEDYSFEFDGMVLFDENTKLNSLEVSLKKGSANNRYTVSYTIDNKEPRKTYQETFSDTLTKTYELPEMEPGEHTVNLIISTDKFSTEMDIPYTINDYSFEVKADIEYDSDNLSHILFLTLMKGSRDESYTIAYTVDGGHAVKLADISGRELAASFTENFKDATVRSYAMTRATKGKHTMKLVISTKDYLQEIEVPYEVKAIPFSIHTEINTAESAGTKMMLSLKEGDNATTYDVSILYDGEVIKGYSSAQVNFSSTPIKTLTMPLLRPGKHDISIEVTDGYTTETAKLNYSEPVRHPYIDITLKHNESNGRHEAVIGDNPYGIELSIKTMLTITGKSTYCTSTMEYYYSDITYKSKTKVLSDNSSFSGVYQDKTLTLIDQESLAVKMTSSYEMSNVMTYFPGEGDGECVGHDEWRQTGTERAYYQITEETLKIDITGEKVTGVTIRVKNEIGAMTLNGKSSTSGTTNITL